MILLIFFWFRYGHDPTPTPGGNYGPIDCNRGIATQRKVQERGKWYYPKQKFNWSLISCGFVLYNY